MRGVLLVPMGWRVGVRGGGEVTGSWGSAWHQSRGVGVVCENNPHLPPPPHTHTHNHTGKIEIKCYVTADILSLMLQFIPVIVGL